jgi:general secretion pathway protein G
MVRLRAPRGFTLVELLVVLAIIAVLLSVAAPRYSGSVGRAKEAVLRENLASLRDALDKHYSDTGQYPAKLEELVGKRYLRRIPLDPVTESPSSWVLVPPPGPDKGGIADVHSGSREKARDGTFYKEW